MRNWWVRTPDRDGGAGTGLVPIATARRAETRSVPAARALPGSTSRGLTSMTIRLGVDDDGVDREGAVPVERLAQPGQIGPQAGSVGAGLGRCTSVRPFLHALVGVEGDEGSGVEDALGHDEGDRSAPPAPARPHPSAPRRR